MYVMTADSINEFAFDFYYGTRSHSRVRSFLLLWYHAYRFCAFSSFVCPHTILDHVRNHGQNPGAAATGYDKPLIRMFNMFGRSLKFSL